MPASTPDLQALARFAAARGVTELPGVLGNCLRAHEALTSIRREGNVDAAAVLRSHIRAGTLTEETVSQTVTEAASSIARATTARDLSAALETVVVAEATTALHGDDGDELTALLRPAFTTDLDALAAVMAHVPEGMSADVAIERGPEAIEAYQQAPEVSARMFAWYRDWASLLANRFNIPARGGLYVQHPAAAIAAYFVAPGGDLDHAAAVLVAPNSDRRGPFARIFALSGGAVRLNSPREAVALIDDITEAAANADARRRAEAVTA